MFNCICTFCNNSFQSKQPSAKICDSCKNRPCVICGKEFVHVWPYDQKCCSAKCRKILINDPEHQAQALAKRDETVKMRYGVSNVNELSSVKNKIIKSRTDKEAYFEEKAKEIEASKKPIIRKCVICGNEFEATGNQLICKKQHYRQCVICGRNYEVNKTSNVRSTCSDECWRKLMLKNTESKIRTCEYCGKPFRSSGLTVKYCPGPHYRNCSMCGKLFEIDFSKGYSLETAPKTCSSECTILLAKQTSLLKYGFESAHQSPESREKFRQKSLETAEVRAKTNVARYGYSYPSKNPEIREKISQTIASDENQAKMRATMQERYGVDYAMQNHDLFTKQHQSKSTTYACDGTRVDSKWEKIFYDFLFRNKIPFEYNTVSIPYEFEERNHVLHVDFKVNDILFEVKGDHLLEGVGEGVPISVKIDLYKKYHIIVICSTNVNNLFGKPNSKVSNGLKYLNKCPEPLIGVDISLFDHPDFPFAEDRPPCFYKVKVDGARSSLEAFYDEQIRWKMILNRINYSGGFIDAKQVLTAMNVTRTCKQPSWFSKQLASDVIQKYCSSDTIVDPFAGWGTRHDAAVELGRNYVGLDFNLELVEWHKEHNRNIMWGDANEFKFDDECSVFICPPYSDPETGRCFEDYSFEGFDESAKSLSQCDWLKIVMKNVPNASEYVMVCKIVDEDFKQYVVETIENSSHFGVNNEYILVVRR